MLFFHNLLFTLPYSQIITNTFTAKAIEYSEEIKINERVILENKQCKMQHGYMCFAVYVITMN